MTILKPIYIIFIFAAMGLFGGTVSFAGTAAPPNLILATGQGKLSLNELKGTVVYVDFWASWCGPCRKSFPWMNEMQARYGKRGFKIIAVNVDEEPGLAKKFLTEYPSNFTIAYDPDGVAAKAFKVTGMPNSYLIGRDGRMHSTHIGFREKDIAKMEVQIKNLIAQ